MEATLNCDDILIEILLRVPVKTLIRLKCISKHWLNLISSPSFGQNHALRASYSVSGFYFNIFQLFRIPFHSHGSLPPPFSFVKGAVDECTNFSILDSRCGLMLCLHEKNSVFHYSVANPTTQKYKVIPSPPPTKIITINKFTCLAFDPLRSVHYNVVTLRHDYHKRFNEIDTYSSEDELWRRKVYVDRGSTTPLNTIVFWNGAVHWLDDKYTHFQFDVDTKKLVENPLPNKTCGDSVFPFLIDCGGDLLMFTTTNWGNKIYEITRGTNYHWRLKDAKQSQPNRADDSNVLTTFKRSHVSDDILCLLAVSGTVYSYNAKKHSMEVIYEFHESDLYGIRKCSVHPYIESLSSV